MPGAFTLGQQVTWHTSNELFRTAITVHDSFMYARTRKVWRSPADQGILFGQMRSGVIVGERVLSNGILRYHGHDEPVEYALDEVVPVVLVAYDLRRKPVHIQPHLIREES